MCHGCFWRYHPERAYAWALQLQEESEPAFTIDEADSDACRARFVADRSAAAAEIHVKELKRRERKASKAGEDDGQQELLGAEAGDDPEDD